MIGLSYALHNAADVEVIKAEEVIGNFMVKELRKSFPNHELVPFDDSNLPWQVAVRKHFAKGIKRAGISSKEVSSDSGP